MGLKQKKGGKEKRGKENAVHLPAHGCMKTPQED
jgi:hypothetical protein